MLEPETLAIKSWIHKYNPVLIMNIRAGSVHVCIPLAASPNNNFTTSDNEVQYTKFFPYVILYISNEKLQSIQSVIFITKCISMVYC